MALKYILYKNPVQFETLAIVQYLYSLGIDMRPNVILEQGHPKECVVLPSIMDVSNNMYYSGLEECIAFFETHTGMTDLLAKAQQFKSTASSNNTSTLNLR